MRTRVAAARLNPYRGATLGCLLIVFFLGWGASQPVWAARESEVDVRIRVAPSEINIGDLIQVDLEVDHPKQFEVRLPDLSPELGPFEVRSVHKRPLATSGETATSGWDLTVSTFEVGQVVLPSLELTVDGADDESFQVTTASVPLEIGSVLPDDAQDILDIKSPRSMPRAWWSYWPWALLLAAAGVAVWWLWRRRRETEALPAAPPLPPGQEALDALRALETSDLLAREQVRDFYTRLSEILRRYLWRRYGIVALEATTSEIVRQLRSADTPLSESAGSILEDCDLVKFAQRKPPRESGLAALRETRDLVEKSRPRRPPEILEEGAA